MADSDIRLTPTSYVVLGLIEAMGSATAYDLKTAARQGVANLWALPHTQLYSESARLAEAGLLNEKREEGGRRRRIYSLTAAGRKQLEGWRADTDVATAWELRDAGLLKLFFGADPAALAASQLDGAPRAPRRVRGASRRGGEGLPAGMRLALDAGHRPRARVPALLAGGRRRRYSVDDGPARSDRRRAADPRRLRGSPDRAARPALALLPVAQPASARSSSPSSPRSTASTASCCWRASGRSSRRTRCARR